jgi:hypothetical protein
VVPPDQRPIVQEYVWSSATPLRRLRPAIFSPVPDKLAEDFAIRAIEAQPVDYAQLDRYLQKSRIREACYELPPDTRVLDIGTHDGTLFCLTRARGLGIDPELAAVTSIPGVTLVKGSFPQDLPSPPSESFDAVTALAVIEHVPESELPMWRRRLPGWWLPTDC